MSRREEEFYDVSVVIKGMRDLTQSLDEFCHQEEVLLEEEKTNKEEGEGEEENEKK